MRQYDVLYCTDACGLLSDVHYKGEAMNTDFFDNQRVEISLLRVFVKSTMTEVLRVWSIPGAALLQCLYCSTLDGKNMSRQYL